MRRGGLCVGQVVLLAAAGTLVWDKVLAAGGGEPGGRAGGREGGRSGSGGLGAGRCEAQTPLASLCFLLACFPMPRFSVRSRIKTLYDVCM